MSEETISYCFKKGDISPANQQTPVTDADDSFKKKKSLAILKS